MALIRSLLLLFFAAITLTLSGCGGATNTTEDPAGPATADATEDAEDTLDLSYLSPEDQSLAQQQKFCPVGGKDALLGSGGMKAVKVNVEGRDVFLCCDGCEEALRADPKKYFAILDGTDAGADTTDTSDADDADTDNSDAS